MPPVVFALRNICSLKRVWFQACQPTPMGLSCRQSKGEREAEGWREEGEGKERVWGRVRGKEERGVEEGQGGESAEERERDSRSSE